MMQIKDLRYNDRIGAFEGSVDTWAGARRLRIPCKVFGPASLHPTIITANMAKQAERLARQS